MNFSAFKDHGKIIATVECRMTSSRLPGKILKPACGKPMLELLVERLKRVKQLDGIVLATTVNTTDDPVENLAGKLDVACFRGSEEDVLARVLGAAKSQHADIIVEITGDCPLVDPVIVSQVVDLYLTNECDYASNLDPDSFPIGMDVQVFAYGLLALAEIEGRSAEDREHVSWFIRRQPERFRKIRLPAPVDLHFPHYELTLDEESDYLLLKSIFENLYPEKEEFSCYDIVKYLSKHPDLLKINEGVDRKSPDCGD